MEKNGIDMIHVEQLFDKCSPVRQPRYIEHVGQACAQICYAIMRGIYRAVAEHGEDARYVVLFSGDHASMITAACLASSGVDFDLVTLYDEDIDIDGAEKLHSLAQCCPRSPEHFALRVIGEDVPDSEEENSSQLAYRKIRQKRERFLDLANTAMLRQERYTEKETVVFSGAMMYDLFGASYTSTEVDMRPEAIDERVYVRAQGIYDCAKVVEDSPLLFVFPLATPVVYKTLGTLCTKVLFPTGDTSKSFLDDLVDYCYEGQEVSIGGDIPGVGDILR